MRYWLETLGCPKNQVDSDKLVGTLVADGYQPAGTAEQADLVVENPKKQGKGLGSTERFSLALVQANIRSQAGVYACVEDPLHLSLKLPLQGMESPGSEVAIHSYSIPQLH